MVQFRGVRVDDHRLSTYLKTHRPQFLSLYNTSVTDRGIDLLRQCSSLQEVEIYNCGLGDCGFQSLCKIKSIRSILLHQCPNVTDVALEALDEAKNLRELYLNQTKITNAAMEIIGRQPEIWSLSLENTLIDDAGLELLASLTTLSILMINGCPATGIGLLKIRPKDAFDVYMKATRATDASVEAFSTRNPPIRRLDLSDTAITDRGATMLARIERLENLRIINTAVTDEALVAFFDHPALQCLEPEGTLITVDGIAALKRVKRRLQVYGM